ncbi:MAG: hypothetical protein L3J71_06155 [Victivallaceae bacterium]|nr:hypothetical protein [Victivallaceae bacterium]
MLISLAADSVADTPARKIVVKTVEEFFTPNNPEKPYTRHLIDFMSEHPEIDVREWGGISIPGGGSVIKGDIEFPLPMAASAANDTNLIKDMGRFGAMLLNKAPCLL